MCRPGKESRSLEWPDARKRTRDLIGRVHNDDPLVEPAAACAQEVSSSKALPEP